VRRRDFISGLGGAAVTWPCFAQAQQKAMPVIGYLHLGSSDAYAAMVAAFRDGLKETGYTEGQNVAIEYRWADGRPERLPELIADLLQKKVLVLATGGGNLPAQAAKEASRTIPIIFVSGSDPVESHLVESLAHPGSNVTGVSLFTWELGPKRFGLLRELVPQTGIVAVLVDNNEPHGQAVVEEAAQAIGQKIEIVRAGNAQEIDEAFNTISQMRADALILLSTPFFTNSRHQIVALANHNRIPAIFPHRQYMLAGGLVSYGPNIVDAYRQSGVYTGRILKGEKPNDLPVQQPTKFDLVINLKTAKMLGVRVPDSLLAQADEVIE
jgi:putative ABC transport system substrate-binding protein